MKKKLISILTAAAMLFPSFAGADAADYERNGCSLAPVSYDETGVLPQSLYVLKGDTGENPVVTVNDSITTTVTRTADGSYTVAPDKALSFNTLYTFKLEGETPVTWTFQTAEKFCVENFFPGNDSYDVPVNTGIEITFSHEDFDIESVKKNFSIDPQVGGKWEKHKSTAVFIPSRNLSYNMQYTVTLSENAKRSGGETIGQELCYSFDTADKQEQSGTSERKPYLSENYTYMDVAADTRPSVGVYAAIFDGSQNVSIKTEVFRISEETAVKWYSGSASLEELAENPGSPVQEKTAEYNSGSWRAIDIELPDKLREGIYIVKNTMGDSSVYTMLQATDIAAYITADPDNYAVWVNDYRTGKPLGNVKLLPDGAAADVKTGADGTAYVPRKADCRYMRLDAPNGKKAYFPINDEGRYGSKNKYRSALITDRTLYKADDTVYVWGTVRDFDSGEAPEGLTVELYDSCFWRYSDKPSPAAVGELEINDNSFSGKLELPNVSAGSYEVRITDGTENAASCYITVEDYEKPAYKLTITPEKKAVFYGETAQFTLKTAFFEGTPLPGLDISCKIGSGIYKSEQNSGKTDEAGEMRVSFTPEIADTDNSFYGECRGGVSAYAALPETGDISSAQDIRVFLNNVRFVTGSSYKDGKTTYTLHSDTITLDRLNDGTAEYYFDYIDKADAGRSIKLSLYRVSYETEQSGTRYDYVTKKNMPVYEYVRKEKLMDEKELISDNEGNLSYEFTPDNKDKYSYYMKAECTDDLGRKYKTETYLSTSERTWRWYGSYSGDRFYMNTDKEKYDIGDTAHITVTRGMEPVEGNMLMLKDCNGIKEMQVSTDGEFETEFHEAPRAYITCVLFEPEHGYNKVIWDCLEYDTENSRLSLEISADKDSYSPGDDCTVNITAKTADGSPAEADINVCLADEALLALSDNTQDVLEELYSRTYMCAYRLYISHTGYYFFNGSNKGYTAGGGGGGSPAPMLSTSSASAANVEEAAAADDFDAGSADIRSDFRDTAVFVNTRTGRDGKGSVTFKLPDNITSWRAMINGVTAGLDAGTAEYPVAVSMPAFISCNMSDTYITGDTPEIGVNLYGGSLSGNEEVVFTVSDGTAADTAQARPFERVNIPLSMMTEPGKKTVAVTADINGKPADAVSMDIEVVDTYNTTDVATFYDTPYDELKAGSGGNIKVVFTDANRASLLSGVYSLRGCIGDRIDQKTAYNIARELLNDYYNMDYPIEEISFGEYQSEDGGIKLFPYGNSDLDATAKLTPYIKDKVDKHRLIEYLKNNRSEVKALYALACLREPVLNDLKEMAAADNLRASEYLYIALAYCELGEYGGAEEIYNSRITDKLEDTTPDKRVRDGIDNDDILDATALASVVSLYIGNEDAESLYRYCMRNYTTDILINIEKLMYISAAVKTLPQENGSVIYSMYGKTYEKQFRGTESLSVTVPAKNTADFKVLKASASVRMMSVAAEKMQLDTAENQDIKIERVYTKTGSGERTNEFAETDIVKVSIGISYGAQAEDGGYVITDYLPSGLTPITNCLRNTGGGSWRMVCDGQRVSLYSYNGSYGGRNDTLTYYARVTNPGTYTADNAVLQSARSTDILAVTPRENIMLYSIH